MSTGINIAPSSDLTVGTTAVTSGTDTRVFFQAGGVVQQDANFTFDNTLKRLTLKAVGTAATDIPFTVQNSAGTVNLLQQNGVGSILARSNDTFSYAGLFYRTDGTNGFSLTNSHSGYGQGTGIETVGNNLYFLNTAVRALSVSTQGTGTFKTYGIWNYGSGSGQRLLIGENVFDPQVTLSGTGNLGIGTYTAGARLDVKAQGALSTDIAFRVRNSADTLNTFQSTGDGKTKMQGSIYYTEFDPANGLYVGNNFGNMINLSGVLQGTSWFNAGADGKLAVGRGTANYRFHVNSSTTNSNIPACFNNENNDVNGQNGIAFTTTWTGSAFGNIGGILYMKHTYLGGNNASQNCQFNFDLNYNNSAPTTRASITGRSNVLIGTPTENTADSHTIYIQNGTAPTVALAGGGKLYVEGGALKFIGSSGTITTIAPA